jgi:transposase
MKRVQRALGSPRKITEVHTLRSTVRRLSFEEVAALVDGYQEGATVYELAERFKIHRVTVSEHLRRQGVEMRGQGLYDQQIFEAALLHGRGWSLARFLEFCRYLRSLYPAATRIAIICDNYSPHLTTRKDRRVGTWAKANNVEIAYTPTNSSWLNRIEAQFTALRYFALDGTDHPSHKEQASMIRRYIIWRNHHAYDERLRRIVDRANVA